MTILYWQVYKNLEKEFLGLADVIHVDDKQLEVYSMKIADLLIRTVVEIEAIAKELYLSNGGVIVPDNEMFFDTVCMKHLDSLWNLEKKVVLVVCPSLYLKEEKNKILKPLHKATRRGTSSASWNKAYQAVKHNRVRELTKGNIKNLLVALAALYVLNLYLKDDKMDKVSQGDMKNIDSSFGSELFAVKVHDPHGIRTDGVYIKNTDYDECVYIYDYESDFKRKATDAMKALNDYSNKEIQKILVEKIKERASQGLEITEKWLDKERINATGQIYPVKDYDVQKKMSLLGKLIYRLELNKCQY